MINQHVPLLAIAALTESYERHPSAVQAIIDYLTAPGDRTLTVYASGNIIFKSKIEEHYGGNR